MAVAAVVEVSVERRESGASVKARADALAARLLVLAEEYEGGSCGEEGGIGWGVWRCVVTTAAAYDPADGAYYYVVVKNEGGRWRAPYTADEDRSESEYTIEIEPLDDLIESEKEAGTEMAVINGPGGPVEVPYWLEEVEPRPLMEWLADVIDADNCAAGAAVVRALATALEGDEEEG